MRCCQSVGVLSVLLLSVLPAGAQEMTITYPEVRVYSGPSTKFFPTSTLRAGDKVEVLPPTADNQPGWLAIKPPPGSFSWISQRFVQPSPNGKLATVVADHDVPVLPGSSLTNQPPNVEKLKLKRGSLVVILDQPLYASTGIWLPIAPPPGDVRYIEAYAVKTPNLATGAAATPTPASQQPGHPDNVVVSPRSANDWQPPSPQTAKQPRTPGQTTSLYNKDAPQTPAHITPAPPASQAQYTPYGILRKTAFQMNGQPMYVLEDRQGQVLVYVAAPAGFSLSPYLGRLISVYGTTSYRSDDYFRQHYVTATHVAIP